MARVSWSRSGSSSSEGLSDADRGDEASPKMTCRQCQRELTLRTIRKCGSICRTCNGERRRNYKLRICPDCDGEHRGNGSNVCPVCRRRRVTGQRTTTLKGGALSASPLADTA